MTELVKAQWIAAARASFSPGRRQPCLICGRFAYVSEAHHVVPLGQQFDRGFVPPDHEHVWLCPTHHAVVHVLIDGHPEVASLGRRAAPIVNDHGSDELARLMDLVRMSTRGSR